MYRTYMRLDILVNHLSASEIYDTCMILFQVKNDTKQKTNNKSAAVKKKPTKKIIIIIMLLENGKKILH